MMLRWAVATVLLLGGAVWLFTWWQTRVIERAYPPSGSFVALEDGSRIHYTERRPVGPERATVLLLHGASGNQADMMLALGDRLAALGFRVVAPDRPGHGWSDRPDGAVEAWPARQADVLRAAMSRIGVERAIVVGHSWSGALAADFALDQPDFTQGLVLISPVLYPWSTGIAWYYTPVTTPWFGPLFTSSVTVPLGLMALDAGMREVFAPQSPPDRYAERTGLYLLLRPAEFMANAQDVHGLLAFVTEQAPRLQTIRRPTAIVTGDSDRIVSPTIHSERGAREIPGATLTLLPGTGHSPHWAAPDRVVDAIVDVARRSEQEVPLPAPGGSAAARGASAPRQ